MVVLIAYIDKGDTKYGFTTMTHIYQARQRAIAKGRYLGDLRFLWLDNIGISVSTLRKLETDYNYSAHPTVYGKLVSYYEDMILVKDICDHCPISISKENIVYNEYTPVKKSQYDIHRKIRARLKTELGFRNTKRTDYYYARLKYALSVDIQLKNREQVYLETQVPMKVIIKMETNKDFIPDYYYSNILFNFYKDRHLGKMICNNCPVFVESQKIQGGIQFD